MTAQNTGAPTGAPDVPSVMPVKCNTEDDAIYRNVRINGALDLPILQRVTPHDGHAVIVAGGPSAADFIEELRWRQSEGQHIFAMNGTASWLLKKGIVPDFHVIMDARPWNSRFIEGDERTTLYLASQCDPSVFKAAKGRNVVLFHRDCGGNSGHLEKRATVPLGFGTTVGVTAIQIAHELGYKKIHLYGFDSCYREGEGHAYTQPENDGEQIIDVTVAGRPFKCSPWMVRQAEEFRELAAGFAETDSTVTIHGDGLLAWIAKKLSEACPRTKVDRLLTVFYDLALCPASYDVIVTLVAAEQHRKALGYDGIKFVIVPGHLHGFRWDNIEPTSVSHRQQLLWNVVLPAARLLPSVKSIIVCADRDQALPHECEDAFPNGYSVDYPCHAYGFTRMLQGMKIGQIASLKAPEQSVEYAKSIITPNTVTITLRETQYGSSRNSRVGEWIEAAYRLRQAGYRVVIIRDSEQAHARIADFETIPAASFDLALRAAIYELAEVNLFIANGPAGISYLNPNCRTIMFGMISEGHQGLNSEYWEHHEFKPGSQFPGLPNCKIVWEPDTADVIVREALAYLKKEKAA